MRWRLAVVVVAAVVVVVAVVGGRSAGSDDPVPVAVVGATLASRLLAAGDVEEAVGVVERWGSAGYRSAVVPVVRSGFARLRAEAAQAVVSVEVTGTEVLARDPARVVVRVSTVVTVSDAGRVVRNGSVAEVVVVDESGWRVDQVLAR